MRRTTILKLAVAATSIVGMLLVLTLLSYATHRVGMWYVYYILGPVIAFVMLKLGIHGVIRLDRQERRRRGAVARFER